MPNLWNILSDVGVFDEDEDELRRRQAASGNEWDVPQSDSGVDVQNMVPTTPGANSSLRRLFSLGGSFLSDPGHRNQSASEKYGQTAPAPVAGDSPTPMAAPETMKAPSMNPLPRRASDITAEAPVFNNPWEGDPTRTASGRMIDPNAPEGLSSSVPSTREPTRIQQLTDEFEEEKALPADINRSRKKKTFWNRLGGGMWNAYKDWDPSKTGWAGGFDVLTGGLERAFDPKADAEASKDRKLKKIWNDLNQEGQVQGVQQKQDEGVAKINKYYSDIAVDQTNAKTNATKVTNDAQKAERDLLLKTVYEVPEEFDPAAPENAALVSRMRAAGVPVLHKKKGKKFQTVTTPNGDLKVFDPDTGKVVDVGNYAKPPTVNASELKDSMFPGLKSKADIDAAVEAEVGPLPEGRRFKPEFAANLPAAYKNADGSVNEQQLWADYYGAPEGARPPDPSRYYENLPSDYAQRKAKAMKRALDANRPIQEAADTFRLALANHTPKSNAVAVPITRIVSDFGTILKIKDPKKRSEALKRYYAEILPHIRVGE